MKTGQLTIVAGLAICAATLAGCNTVAGLGRDMQAAGRGISHAADATQANASTGSSTADMAGNARKRYPQPGANSQLDCDPDADLVGGSGKPPC